MFNQPTLMWASQPPHVIKPFEAFFRGEHVTGVGWREFHRLAFKNGKILKEKTIRIYCIADTWNPTAFSTRIKQTTLVEAVIDASVFQNKHICL